jgi:murein DD-endopeptidase MepM/ murein hydrolase activator NlpD
LAKQEKSVKKRLRTKYRLAVMNDETSEERFHMRTSLVNLLGLFIAAFVVAFFLLMLIIWATPLRNYLPGYNEDLRKEFIAQTYRLDSLQQEMELRAVYLNSIRDVVSGNVHTDSLPPLDSLEQKQKEAMLAERSQVLEDFQRDYEAREKDNLLLFDQTTSYPVHSFFRPANGVVTEPFNLSQGRFGIVVNTQKDASVAATLTGTIVYEDYVPDEGWMLMVQHDADYLSMYYGLLKPFKQVGASVQAGETLGLVAQETMRFELWQRGLVLNPEEVISF